MRGAHGKTYSGWTLPPNMPNKVEKIFDERLDDVLSSAFGLLGGYRQEPDASPLWVYFSPPLIRAFVRASRAELASSPPFEPLSSSPPKRCRSRFQSPITTSAVATR